MDIIYLIIKKVNFIYNNIDIYYKMSIMILH